MYRYHALPVSGHHGRDNTQRNIKRSYYWDGMDKDISRWVRACAVCQRRKQARRLHVGNASSVQAQRPWEKVAIDIVSASTTHAAGMRYILTALDVFTRWVIAIPLRTKKAKDVADAIFTHILCVHGRPDHIITDEGTEFVNGALRYLYKRWGIQPITTGGYQPQALPVERFHRFLNGAMTMLASKFGDDWATYLPAVTLAYNTSVTVSTGYSPYALMYGRNPRFLEDTAVIQAPLVDEEADGAPDFATALARRLRVAYDHVRNQQERMAQLARDRRQPSHKDITYAVGDSVLYWEPQQRRTLRNEEHEDDDVAAHRGPAKWTPKWTGPHVITAVSHPPGSRNPRYTFLHVERGAPLTVHPNKLCPYHPWSDNSPSTSWELDTTRPYITGAWVQEGSLVIVPLEAPYPFGVGRVIAANTDGTLDIHWLGTNGSNTTPYSSALTTGWKMKSRNGDLHAYYADRRRNKAHQPYRVADDSTVPFTQEDVVLHSFELTETRRLPAAVVSALAEHPAIWWTRS